MSVCKFVLRSRDFSFIIKQVKTSKTETHVINQNNQQYQYLDPVDFHHNC